MNVVGNLESFGGIVRSLSTDESLHNADFFTVFIDSWGAAVKFTIDSWDTVVNVFTLQASTACRCHTVFTAFVDISLWRRRGGDFNNIWWIFYFLLFGKKWCDTGLCSGIVVHVSFPFITIHCDIYKRMCSSLWFSPDWLLWLWNSMLQFSLPVNIPDPIIDYELKIFDIGSPHCIALSRLYFGRA